MDRYIRNKEKVEAKIPDRDYPKKARAQGKDPERDMPYQAKVQEKEVEYPPQIHPHVKTYPNPVSKSDVLWAEKMQEELKKLNAEMEKYDHETAKNFPEYQDTLIKDPQWVIDKRIGYYMEKNEKRLAIEREKAKTISPKRRTKVKDFEILSRWREEDKPGWVREVEKNLRKRLKEHL